MGIVEVSLAVLAFVVVLALPLDMASGSARLRLSLRPMLPSATDTVDMVWVLLLLPLLPPPLLLLPPSSPPGPWPLLLLPSPPLPLVAASLLVVLVLLAPTLGKLWTQCKSETN